MLLAIICACQFPLILDHSYFHDESSEVELPASVQVDENGLVNDRDSPVLPGTCACVCF